MCYHHSQKIMMLSRFVFSFDSVCGFRACVAFDGIFYGKNREINWERLCRSRPDHISSSELLVTSFLQYLLNNLIVATTRAVSKQKTTFNNPASEQKTAHQHIGLSGNEWFPVLPPFCFYYIKVVFKERFLYWNGYYMAIDSRLLYCSKNCAVLFDSKIRFCLF